MAEESGGFTQEQIDAITAALAGTAKEDKPEYKLGDYQGNMDWIAQEYGDSAAQSSWQDDLTRTILKEMTDTAKRIGEDPNLYAHLYNQRSQDFFTYLEEFLINKGRRDPRIEGPQGTAQEMMQEFLASEDGWNTMLDKARDYWKINLSDPRFSDNWGEGPGSGGSGRKLPTAAEIRQQFDVTQLANGVQDIWRGTLLDEHRNPRALAEQYVEAVVATQGQQKIDFQTFVMERAKQTGRYAAIYKNKPEGFSEQQFLQPYVAKAMANVKPSNARGLAIGMAQFNASSQQMDERIKRSDQNQAGSPFINELEGRLTSLNKVFKG